MAKRIELLLLETVENLGIVGDIVKVRPGYARNYLLPERIATAPTPSRIESLKEARATAQAEVSRLRGAREELIARMTEVSVSIKRSCNDQGVLYGSVTQRDVSDALQEAGYDVGLRSVRLSQSIRRVGEYHIPIQFEKDLRTDITLNVEPDRELEEDRDEMEIDEEGNLIEKGGDRGHRQHRDRQDRGEDRGSDRGRDRGRAGGRDRARVGGGDRGRARGREHGWSTSVKESTPESPPASP